MPFWVIVEAWDFGIASKYYEILKDGHRNRICKRFGLTHAKILKEWLQEISIPRNRCAHHSRIWNQISANPVPTVPKRSLLSEAQPQLECDESSLWSDRGTLVSGQKHRRQLEMDTSGGRRHRR
ncbi:Abi family protein [Pseudomonas corrugata]|uniref:Abi family protein n=1 Tax=Pseudomonas corrugata TaxID=47879 RepID=UPI0024C0C823|nr:Abi family protein [Pseudomonas corrugata]